MTQRNKFRYILTELAHHLPFSIFGVASGLIFVGILIFFTTITSAERLLPHASDNLFHFFHPAHILFSAVTTTAMFWKHEKNISKGILIGFLGSISICGLSDILIPFIGGKILGENMHLHICLIENPLMIISFAALGVLSGLMVKDDNVNQVKYSHSAHVFISSAASILYLISFGLTEITHLIGVIFVITILAVMLPCCLSDIVFPLTCAHTACGCDND